MPSKSFRTSNSFFSQEEQKPKRTKLPKGMKPVNANPEPTEEKASAPDIPEGFKLVPAETKSKRLQLLITPSLHRKLQDLAKAENISINEVANRAFDYYIENYLKGGF